MPTSYHKLSLRSSKDCQGLSLGAPAVGLQQKEATALVQLLPRAKSSLHRPHMGSLLQLLLGADSALRNLLRSSLQQIPRRAESPHHSQLGSFLQLSQRAESAFLLPLHRAVRAFCSKRAAPMGRARQGQAFQKPPASAQRALRAQHKLLF